MPASTSPTASRIEVKAGPAAAAAIAAHLDDGQAARRWPSSLGKTAGAPAGTVSEGKLGDEPITLGVEVAG